MGLACRILQETVGFLKRAASPYGIHLWGNPQRTFRRVIRRLRPRPLFSLARPWFSRNYRLGYDQIGQPWIWLEPTGCDFPLIAASRSTGKIMESQADESQPARAGWNDLAFGWRSTSVVFLSETFIASKSLTSIRRSKSTKTPVFDYYS